jgi:hypothetical protein
LLENAREICGNADSHVDLEGLTAEKIMDSCFRDVSPILIANPERQEAATDFAQYWSRPFAIPILALMTAVATLVLIYMCCRTVSPSNFMLSRALLDPTSRWIGIFGFAIFGCLLISCEMKAGTSFGRPLIVAFAVFLETLVIDNYGVSHVIWTIVFFLVASAYLLTCVRLPKLSLVYALAIAAFFLAWLLGVGDGVVSILQLLAIGMLVLVVTVHMFDAYAKQLNEETWSCSPVSSHERSEF